jgi:hypothetical protein
MLNQRCFYHPQNSCDGILQTLGTAKGNTASRGRVHTESQIIRENAELLYDTSLQSCDVFNVNVRLTGEKLFEEWVSCQRKGGREQSTPATKQCQEKLARLNRRRYRFEAQPNRLGQVISY